jgi:hypothetical protein
MQGSRDTLVLTCGGLGADGLYHKSILHIFLHAALRSFRSEVGAAATIAVIKNMWPKD